jgi:hypothetical protein
MTRATEGRSIRGALERLRALLVPGERLEATAVQRRIFALVHRRGVLGATTGRLIFLRRGLLGGFVIDDVRWQDLQDTTLREGVLGSVLTLTRRDRSDLATGSPASGTLLLDGLRKSEAQAIYRCCQAQEQAWREKRRVRELEELRARSGGVQLGGGVGETPASGGGEDPVARLARAREMLDTGLITDAEYEAVKARMVSVL